MKRFVVSILGILLYPVLSYGANMNIAWTDNVDSELEYRVYKCGTSIGACNSLSPALPPNTTSWVHEGLSEGTYHYMVIAFRGSTNIQSVIFTGVIPNPMTGSIDNPTATPNP